MNLRYNWCVMCKSLSSLRICFSGSAWWKRNEFWRMIAMSASFSWIPGHPGHPSHPSHPTSRLYLQIIALPRSTSWLGASPATACVVVNLKSLIVAFQEKLRPLDIQGLDTLKWSRAPCQTTSNQTKESYVTSGWKLLKIQLREHAAVHWGQLIYQTHEMSSIEKHEDN